MEDYELLAVISLPAGVFKPYAGVKTGILVFRKPVDGESRGQKAEKKDSGKVWFYEIKNDGYDPDKIMGGGRPETPEQNDIPQMLRQWQTFKASGFKKPPGVEYGTLLQAGSEEPRCWWAKSSLVSENDYNLAAGRYKPQVAEKAPQEDPAELITRTLKMEREITSGLEKLLREVERA